MPKSQTAHTQIYDMDYFSGSQCFLYIGDVWIDEVTSLRYQRTQNKQPIYGYASQLFDDVAAGQVLVQGQFTINYKEQGYLWAVLRRFHNIGIDGIQKDLAHIQDKNKRSKTAKYEQSLLAGGGPTARPVTGSNGTVINRASIERIANGNVTRQERNDFYQELQGFSTFNTGSPKDRQFEDIVEAFEDQVWTKSNNGDLNSQIRRIDDNAFDNFDMYVVFGNYAIPKANHTVQKIIGVHLTSESKAIMIDGAPVQEEYSFIAQTTA